MLQSLVWLLAGGFVAKGMLTRRAVSWAWLARPVWQAVGLLALALGISTLHAANPGLSLWGSYHRGQGAVAWWTYLLLFTLAALRFRDLFRARRVIVALAAAVGPIILLSLAQAGGWQPWGLSTDARSPIFATLGRANFVGAYLAMLVPLTLYLLLTARGPLRRGAWAAMLGGELLALGLTQARGAWLAAGVGLIVFALLRLDARLGRWMRRLAWGVVALLFASGPLAVLWLGPRTTGSIATRSIIWRDTLALIARRPLTGYGPDSLGLVFPQAASPDLVYVLGRTFFVDRAHNTLLDWLVMAGLPGLLAWGFLVVVALGVIVQALRGPLSREKRVALIGIFAALVGNLARTLVSFDVTVTAMAFWLLLGMGVALASPSESAQTPAAERPGWRRWLLVGVLAAGIGLVIWQVNARQLMADIAARTAQLRARSGDGEGAVIAAQRAATQWPAEPRHLLLLSRMHWSEAASQPETASISLVRAEAALQAAQRLRPGDATIWLQTARFYATVTGGERQRDEAYRRAVALAPARASIYRDWGRAYLLDGDAAAAAALLRKAVQLDASDAEAFLSLGEAELALGRAEVAAADFREALRLTPDSSPAYSGLAASLWQLGRQEDATRALQQALQFDPNNLRAIRLEQLVNHP
ncbi:MAG TPA: hypothetical protein ENK30_02025 [Anaerolineae bacterium]|nr:hypothetical protein [Anaerolineae bacterium]